MDKLPNYNGSIDLISGLRPKNNGTFPLMEAHDVQVTETQRLDEMFSAPESWLPVYNGENEGGTAGGGSGGGNYVLELTGENGTLTDEQYQAVVDNFPNVVVFYSNAFFSHSSRRLGNNFLFIGEYPETLNTPTENIKKLIVLVEQDKTYTLYSNIPSGGTAGGGSDIVVEVNELPTENIDENTIYLLNKGYADVNVYYCYGSGYMSLAEAVASSIGATPTVYYEVVSELPSNPTATDLQAFNPIYCYIYNNIPYAYGNAGSGDMWLTVSALFAQLGTTVEDKGWTSNIANETEKGLYITYNGRYISYTRKNGAWITICDNNVDAEEEIELIGEHSEQDDSYLDHIITLSEETKQVILEKFAKNPKGFKIYYPIEITGVDNAESIIVVENASVFKANNSIINMGGNGFYTTLANTIPCCVMLYLGLDNSLKFRICDIWKRLLGKPTLTDITPRIKFIY